MHRFSSLGLALAVVVIPAAARAQGAAAAEPSVIVAQGEAVLTDVPDRAFVQIAAEGRAPKSADAQRLAAVAMTSVQGAVKALGIAADAIRTTGYQLQSEYDYNNGRQTFRDYLARSSVEVRLDDFSKLSAVIDAAGASGAASIAGLRFDLKNRSTRERDALRLAVADAMERAKAIAEGAGRTLGGIVRIQEQRIAAAPPMYRTAMAAVGGAGGGVPTPIEPGQIEIRASVTLSVAIK